MIMVVNDTECFVRYLTSLPMCGGGGGVTKGTETYIHGIHQKSLHAFLEHISHIIAKVASVLSHMSNPLSSNTALV